MAVTLSVSNNKKMNINETQSKLQSIGLILIKQTAKSKFLSKVRYSVSPSKKQEVLQIF